MIQITLSRTLKVSILLIGIQFFSGALRAQDFPGVKTVPANQKAAEKEIAFPKASQYSNTKISYKLISAPANTYAYDIYADGKIMIHQTSIPAMQGNEGFKTKAAAEKVAQLVIGKIKKGEMPPTVSIEEMKKLKVISK